MTRAPQARAQQHLLTLCGLLATRALPSSSAAAAQPPAVLRALRVLSGVRPTLECDPSLVRALSASLEELHLSAPPGPLDQPPGSFLSMGAVAAAGGLGAVPTAQTGRALLEALGRCGRLRRLRLQLWLPAEVRVRPCGRVRLSCLSAWVVGGGGAKA